jgi:quercetin dioxygenase-like cupin family protein
MGLGFGMALLWAARSARLDEWRNRIRSYLQRRRTHTGFKSISVHQLEWARNQRYRDKVTYFMKPLFRHPRTDEAFMLVRYPAGQINPSHVHSTSGHGMYVLSGTLVTHRGRFGPGTFVWFPPNEVMHHGAGPEEDLHALFIVGGDCDTDYVNTH